MTKALLLFIFGILLLFVKIFICKGEKRKGGDRNGISAVIDSAHKVGGAIALSTFFL